MLHPVDSECVCAWLASRCQCPPLRSAAVRSHSLTTLSTSVSLADCISLFRRTASVANTPSNVYTNISTTVCLRGQEILSPALTACVQSATKDTTQFTVLFGRLSLDNLLLLYQSAGSSDAGRCWYDKRKSDAYSESLKKETCCPRIITPLRDRGDNTYTKQRISEVMWPSDMRSKSFSPMCR